LSHFTSPFLLYLLFAPIFSDRVLHSLTWLATNSNPPVTTSQVAGIIGTSHHSQFSRVTFKKKEKKDLSDTPMPLYVKYLAVGSVPLQERGTRRSKKQRFHLQLTIYLPLLPFLPSFLPSFFLSLLFLMTYFSPEL
jgi:hypothetical protein